MCLAFTLSEISIDVLLIVVIGISIFILIALVVGDNTPPKHQESPTHQKSPKPKPYGRGPWDSWSSDEFDQTEYKLPSEIAAEEEKRKREAQGPSSGSHYHH